MKTVSVEIVSGNTYYFSTDSKRFAKLHYPRWFSSSAELSTSDDKQYTIAATGVWGTTVALQYHDELLFRYKTNWKGQTLITNLVDHRSYTFAMRGFWNTAYVLKDHQGKELMTIRQKYIWKTMHPNYEISLQNLDPEDRSNQLLLVLAFYCYKAAMNMIAIG